MRIAFAVFCLLIAHVACYPSLSENANDDDDNLELELRSLLKNYENEKMARSFATDNVDDDQDDTDDDEYLFSKREGNNKKVDASLKCGIKCVHDQRHPKVGKGKTVKEATKICNKMCPAAEKGAGKKAALNKKQHVNNKAVREFVDDDLSNSSEEQQAQRREFYDYLMEQLQQNNNE